MPKLVETHSPTELYQNYFAQIFLYRVASVFSCGLPCLFPPNV